MPNLSEDGANRSPDQNQPIDATMPMRLNPTCGISPQENYVIAFKQVDGDGGDQGRQRFWIKGMSRSAHIIGEINDAIEKAGLKDQVTKIGPAGALPLIPGRFTEDVKKLIEQHPQVDFVLRD